MTTPKPIYQPKSHLLAEHLGRQPTALKPGLWHFPNPANLTEQDSLVFVGADLQPETILSAYSHGYFPMPVDENLTGWFSPDPRGILRPEDFHQSRSLNRAIKKFDITMNEAFGEVLAGCANPTRPHGWIDTNIAAAYTNLHELGWAHSIEVWDQDHNLAGGLYGLAIDNLFAGESMFHTKTDASKVALNFLANLLKPKLGALIDVQWLTPHLASLGATEISRAAYLDMLAKTQQN